MRRLWAVGVFVVGALVAAWHWPTATAEAPAPAGAGAGRVPAPVGVGSCAAAACHHGNGEIGEKGSEYSSWVAVDPHARAYRTLFSTASKAMHEALAKGDPAMAKAKGAHDNPLCLRCHGMGDTVPPALHQDGTGCEQCHGPASGWKNTHYLNDFDRKTAGFVDLRDDLSARAQTCMKCHVGDATREVNHDLIAAGHPRLRFEYAAYFANYPRHWDDAALAKRDGKDREARAWVVGQLTAAKAALELLAHRADEKKGVPWPEFAEHDCAACHHGLSKPSFRQERDAEGAGGPKGLKVRAGDLPWGTWYYSQLPPLMMKDRQALAMREGNALSDRLSNIQRAMRKKLPNQQTVRAEATGAAALLGSWLTKAKTVQYAPEQVEDLMRAVAKWSGPLERGHDGGIQVYLGLAALHHARGDLDAAFRERSALKGPLGDLRKVLHEAFPKGARPAYDSALHYDPNKARDALQALRESLK